MCLRPRTSVKQGIKLRNVVNSPTVPLIAAKKTQQRKKATFKAAKSFNRLNRVIGTTWIISAAGCGIRGNMTLVPANGTNHPVSVTTGVHYRRTALRFTASKHAAICCSNDRKSACAALGLARNTISQDSGKADSYFRASTRKRRLTALRVTALPTALETAKPTRRPRIAAESSIMASSCTK